MRINAVLALEKQIPADGANPFDLTVASTSRAIAEHILGNLDEADKQYQNCAANGFDSYMALVGISFILQQRGELESYRWLVDYGSFPILFDVAEEKGREKTAAFNETLYAAIIEHPSLKPEVHYEAPRAKYITDNFTRNDAPEAIAALIDLVGEKIDHIRDTTTPLAGHPFLGKIPTRYRIEMFGALLDRGGYHSPHVHSDAWLSGGYYTRVPDLSADDNPSAGFLEFGKMLHMLPDGFKGKRHYVEPREGLMAVWPSYYIHNTIPCRDSRQRLTIGFNVYADD
ncbi:MAG: hypothetical protein IH994_03240 [Proteobacteria bacterium]|nr:hypothetical protein [Pseudomonadota bacterium]